MSKTAYKTTVLKVSVCPEGEDPILSEKATDVSLADEGGGPFVEIRQSNSALKTGVVRLDFDELEPVAEAFFALLAGLKK